MSSPAEEYLFHLFRSNVSAKYSCNLFFWRLNYSKNVTFCIAIKTKKVWFIKVGEVSSSQMRHIIDIYPACTARASGYSVGVGVHNIIYSVQYVCLRQFPISHPLPHQLKKTKKTHNEHHLETQSYKEIEGSTKMYV